jgi:hypothetical protein
MKKTNRIKLAGEIISRVKKEMQEPRLTESVRDGLSIQARPDVNGFPVKSVTPIAVQLSRNARFG